MINIPFSSEFYTVFPAPNSEELISKIDDVCNSQQVDNDFFEWGVGGDDKMNSSSWILNEFLKR